MAQEVYQIRVKGHLDQHWSNWLEELTMTHLENGETLLSGYLADQAALYGVLYKLQNLGVPLIVVCRVSPNEAQQ
jgi:SPX domain protein involved in polyphosphate accumulation